MEFYHATNAAQDWHLSPLSMRATRPSTHSHQPSVPLDGRSRSQVSVSGVESECPGNESSLGVKSVGRVRPRTLSLQNARRCTTTTTPLGLHRPAQKLCRLP